MSVTNTPTLGAMLRDLVQGIKDGSLDAESALKLADRIDELNLDRGVPRYHTAHTFIERVSGVDLKVDNFRPSLRAVVDAYLFLEHHIDTEEYAAMIKAFQKVAATSPESHNSIMEGLGLTPDEYFGILKRFPQFANLSMENHIATITALKITTDEYAEMVLQHPQTAGYSVEKMVSTLNWYTGTFGVDKKALLSSPVMFSYSLYGRAMPRHQYMEALGLESDFKSFSWLVKRPDEAFITSLQRIDERANLKDYQTLRERHPSSYANTADLNGLRRDKHVRVTH